MPSKKSPGKKGKSGLAPLDLPKGLSAQKFVRTRDNGIIIPAILDLGTAWSFKLNQVPDFSEFATLYDAYIIDKVELMYVLEGSSTSLGVVDRFPTLLIAPDYDDENTPSTENEVLTRQGLQIIPFTASKRSHTFVVEPRLAMTAFRTGITSAYGWSKPGQLLDISVTDAPFYGVKSWLSNYNFTETPNASMRVFVKYHLRMVNQR